MEHDRNEHFKGIIKRENVSAFDNDKEVPM